MLWTFAFVACSPTAPFAEPPPAEVRAVRVSTEPPPEANAQTPEAGTPVLCDEPIYVAQAGWATDEPVPADPHVETFGAAPTPYHLRLGWTGDPSSTMSFLWRTDADTLATQVRIGPDASVGNTLDGASFALGVDGAEGRVHELRVCGLSPGSTWHYQVGGGESWSPVYTFTTAPPPGSDVPVVFGVAGDTRGNPDTWGQILGAMEAHGVDFRIFTGDAVTNGGTVSQWDDWLDEGAGAFERVPTMMAHGNHEGLSQVYFALASLPGDERTYSFDYADMHFAAVNDTVASSGDWQVQADWLAADLAATARTWKVVFHHKPAYSGCRPNGEDANVRAYFVPVEEAGGVQLDLGGHNHNYERTVPLLGGEEVAQIDGVTYVVTAGGGAPLYENNQEAPYTATFTETQHYAIGTLSGGILTMTAYDLAGNVIDSFTLEP